MNLTLYHLLHNHIAYTSLPSTNTNHPSSGYSSIFALGFWAHHPLIIDLSTQCPPICGFSEREKNWSNTVSSNNLEKTYIHLASFCPWEKWVFCIFLKAVLVLFYAFLLWVVFWSLSSKLGVFISNCSLSLLALFFARPSWRPSKLINQQGNNFSVVNAAHCYWTNKNCIQLSIRSCDDHGFIRVRQIHTAMNHDRGLP